MKRIIKMSVIALAVSALSGCVAMPQVKESAPVTVTKADYVAKTSMACFVNDFGINLCRGFKVDVTNNTDKPLKIVWDDTAVTFGGNSSGVLPDGYKYADSATSKTPTIVLPHGSVSKEITPSSNIQFRGGNWRTDALTAGNYSVYLALNVKGQETGETFNLSLTTVATTAK